MPERHFVKYTFLKVDPAWRRLDTEQRAADKREFLGREYPQVDLNTKRDTPTFTCVSTPVERALSALDGLPLPDALSLAP